MTDPTPRERRLEEALQAILIGASLHSSDFAQRICQYAKAALSVEGEAPAPTQSPARRVEVCICYRDASECMVHGAGSPPSPSGEEIDVNCECTDEAPYVCPKHHPETLWREYQRLSQENSALRTRAEKADRMLDLHRRFHAKIEEALGIKHGVTGPGCISTTRKVVADLASAREALRQFGKHTQHCVKVHWDRKAAGHEPGCICGLDAALSGAPPVHAPAPPTCNLHPDDGWCLTHKRWYCRAQARSAGGRARPRRQC